MDVIESFSQGKNPAAANEDTLVVSDDFVAVVDGSTSKSSHPFRTDQSNGALASSLLSAFIREMPGRLSCEQFCRQATRLLHDYYASGSLSLAELAECAEQRLTASVIVYSRRRREIWMVGDCQCLVDGIPFTNEKPVERENALLRSAFLREALESGRATVDTLRHDDIGRAAIRRQLIASCRRQNIDFAVIDGFPVAMHRVRMLAVPVARELVLASDGYPKLFRDLASTEAYLERVIREDPLFIRLHPATKGVLAGNVSFDDRTYVRFRVG